MVTLSIIADHCYAECGSDECSYAECRILFIIVLNVIVQSVM
jgi:hypothetical protein